MKVVVITYIPSPYQVELFDAVCRLGRFDLHVVYVARNAPTRPWTMPTLGHDATFLDDVSEVQLGALVDRMSLTVFCWYRHPLLRRLMRRCANGAKAWCYWGEAPGFRFRGLLGAALRSALLRPLAASGAPIWGIGQWAVERYRAEFGERRLYVNVPYFSDLGRFSCLAREAAGTPRRVLYSGSLIRRKGVDTLAYAWRKVIRRHPSATLQILGDGPLRSGLERILRPVAGSVTFHGAVGWAQVPRYYAEADLLCSPSRYDGWGLIVPEALAAGLPVIASSQMGSAVEMIEHGRNGWLVDPADSAALADQLERALALPENAYREMQTNGRQAGERFGVAVGAQRFSEAAHESLQWFLGAGRGQRR